MPSAVEYVEPRGLPRGLDNRSLRRRVPQLAAVLGILGLLAAFAPGLGEVRARIEAAQPGWLGVAVVLELLSCLSYVLMFRPIFCAQMSLRTSYRLGMSELAVGSLVPASGAAGLAFGAWALRRDGMQVRDIAVAYFVLKSAVHYEGRLCVHCAIPECPNLRPPGSGPGATHCRSLSAARQSLRTTPQSQVVRLDDTEARRNCSPFVPCRDTARERKNMPISRAFL